MSAAPQTIIIWDGFVRLFHWSVASLFLLDFWVLEDGDPPHEWAGYALGALVLMRIIWGFIGPGNARFSSFFPTPKRIAAHWRELKTGEIDPNVGHNPFGGAMVIFLLSLLVLVTLSGWMQTLDAFWGEEWVQQLHEISADITMIAVVIHVSAVVLMQILTQIPLIQTMVTGRRQI
jgi:cytochrome b